MNNYTPPYTITSKMLNIISSIREELTRMWERGYHLVSFLDTVQKVGNNLTDNQLVIIENIKLDSKISATKPSEKIGWNSWLLEGNK